MKGICEIGCLLSMTGGGQHPDIHERMMQHVAQLLLLRLVRQVRVRVCHEVSGPTFIQRLAVVDPFPQATCWKIA